MQCVAGRSCRCIAMRFIALRPDPVHRLALRCLPFLPLRCAPPPCFAIASDAGHHVPFRSCRCRALLASTPPSRAFHSGPLLADTLRRIPAFPFQCHTVRFCALRSETVPPFLPMRCCPARPTPAQCFARRRKAIPRPRERARRSAIHGARTAGLRQRVRPPRRWQAGTCHNCRTCFLSTSAATRTGRF